MNSWTIGALKACFGIHTPKEWLYYPKNVKWIAEMSCTSIKEGWVAVAILRLFQSP